MLVTTHMFALVPGLAHAPVVHTSAHILCADAGLTATTTRTLRLSAQSDRNIKKVSHNQASSAPTEQLGPTRAAQCSILYGKRKFSPLIPTGRHKIEQRTTTPRPAVQTHAICRQILYACWALFVTYMPHGMWATRQGLALHTAGSGIPFCVLYTIQQSTMSD